LHPGADFPAAKNFERKAAIQTGEIIALFSKDPLQSRMLEGVRLRSRVGTMVKSDIDQAHKIAKSIEHPWYRCQALAEVADQSDKANINALLQESFESAMRCRDQNRRVNVACWPLRVALKNNLRDLCQLFLDKCAEQITQDMDPISKWCAVSVVHTIKKDNGLLEKFYSTFEEATSAGHGWRVEREIKYMLNDPDIQKDARYIAHLSERQSAIVAWKVAHTHRGRTN
jgi:hypothetical protein